MSVNLSSQKHKYNNFLDERAKKVKPLWYSHPKWKQGHLYENIDDSSAFTGDIYIANSTNTLVALQTGYIWNDESQFDGGEFKDVTDEVWLTISKKGETDEQ